jgi:hypothetical protein
MTATTFQRYLLESRQDHRLVRHVLDGQHQRQQQKQRDG